METIQNTDVVVLGGGAAGIAAAIGAVSKGSKVVLIERNSFLGGKATAAEVGTVCGLYQFSKKEEPEYIVKGFAREFAEKLQAGSKTSPLYSPDGLNSLPYDIEVFKNISLESLNENKVIILFNTLLKDVRVEQGKIISVTVISGETPITIRLRSIVDCSGEGMISEVANLPLIKSDFYQAAAQVFTMQGVTEENEARLGMIIMKALRSAIDAGTLPDFYDRVYVVPGSLKNNCLSLKIGVPLPVTHAAGNLEELKTVAHDFVENLAQFLITHVAVFKNATIRHIAPEVGIRIGKRSVGKYMLTEEDVLSCKKFDDAIANAAWPIEEWEQNKRVKMRYFNFDDHYQVPAGCLRSKSIDNLFMAGRNISATDSAIASARVMGICLQTGYAAGYMAAATALRLSLTDAIKSIQNAQL